jgi:hypothetical protein
LGKKCIVSRSQRIRVVRLQLLLELTLGFTVHRIWSFFKRFFVSGVHTSSAWGYLTMASFGL